MKTHFRLPILLLPFLLLATACGKKGPMLLEPPLLPGAVDDFQVRQSGTDVVLEWSFPEHYTDGKTVLDLPRIETVTVMQASAPLPKESFAKKAKRVGRFSREQWTRRGDRAFAVRLPFKQKELERGQFLFAVQYRTGRHHSPSSPVLELTTSVPAAAVDDLQATREKKTVILRWHAPQLTLAGAPLTARMGYRVYRRIAATPATWGGYLLLTPEPIPAEVYEDNDTGLSGTYEYRVVTVSAPRVESSFSNPASQEIVDTFPPEVPTRLISFRGPNGILLTWERVPDADFSHFRLYRKTCHQGDFELLADKLEENSFRDNKAEKNCPTRYCVSAVDRLGNESEPSPAVEETLE